jgi:hypothetical protein
VAGWPREHQVPIWRRIIGQTDPVSITAEAMDDQAIAYFDDLIHQTPEEPDPEDAQFSYIRLFDVGNDAVAAITNTMDATFARAEAVIGRLTGDLSSTGEANSG